VAQGHKVGLVAERKGMAVGAEHHFLLRGQRVEGEFDGGDEAEGTLTAANEFAEVNTLGLERGVVEGVEIGREGFVDGIAAAAAAERGVGEMVVDELSCGRVGGPAFQLGIYLLQQRAARAAGCGEGGAVAEQTFYFENMMAGASIDERMGATRVVAHHATDAATVAGGCFGAEEKPVGFEKEVELVAHHARLDPDPPFVGVELKDAVEVAADVYNNAVAHNLTGNAGASGAGDKMCATAAGFGYELFDVVLVLRIGHGKGHLAVGGGVSGIGYAVQNIGVEVHGAGYLGGFFDDILTINPLGRTRVMTMARALRSAGPPGSGRFI